MRKIIIIGFVMGAVIAGIGVKAKPQNPNTTNAPSVVSKSSSDLPKGEVKEYQIQKGDTFAGVMAKHGMSYEEASSILNVAKGVFDFTTVSAGKVLKLVFVDEAFAAMEYPLNTDSIVHVKKNPEGYSVTEEDIQYEVIETVAKGVITDSLFLAAQDAGVDDKIILKMADVFSWDIDFASDIQAGDTFNIVYEKRYQDGRPVGAGKLLAARFVNSGTEYYVYRYNDKYYDDEGKSIARQFLKSPLNYTRISSVFTKSRINPVTRNVLPHLAIDYAAPSGTPIISPASGKISLAGRKGDLGIAVEIKHNNGYFTQYGHMSKLANDMKAGVSVSQGDVIGYVGSTGRSTGPHLHYTMSKNGIKVNPLQQNFTREKSLEDVDLEKFKQMQLQMLGKILNSQ